MSTFIFFFFFFLGRANICTWCSQFKIHKVQRIFFFLVVPDLSCGMRDLVPWPGIEPRPPALGAQSYPLDHPWKSQVQKSVGNSLQFLKKLSMELPYDSAIPLLDMYPKRTENKYSNKNPYMSVHSSTIHKSRKVETTQMSISWWMDKQNVLHPYNGI